MPNVKACCNRCNAGFEIGTNIHLERADGGAMTCSGDSCNWSNSCEGFKASENNGPYVLEGTFTLANGGMTLSLDDYRAANCSKGGCRPFTGSAASYLACAAASSANCPFPWVADRCRIQVNNPDLRLKDNASRAIVTARAVSFCCRDINKAPQRK